MARCDSVGLRTGTDTATAPVRVPALGARTALAAAPDVLSQLGTARFSGLCSRSLAGSPGL